MQQQIPPEKLSRVYSYDALGSFVLIPLGYASPARSRRRSASRDALGRGAIVVVVTLPVLVATSAR